MYETRFQYVKTKTYIEHGVVNAYNEEEAKRKINKNKGDIIEKKEEENIELIEDYD